LLLTDNPCSALIPNINDDALDSALPSLNWVTKDTTLERGIHVCQSNSFAFGGNNVSIVIASV
jgi:3-oxoacyl-[acyl-carrier-protein] synthase-1